MVVPPMVLVLVMPSRKGAVNVGILVAFLIIVKVEEVAVKDSTTVVVGEEGA